MDNLAQWQQDLIADLKSIRDNISHNADFPAAKDLRDVYVAIMTIEGCVRFGDASEFAELCVSFCDRKCRTLIGKT
jgi:hypothetical protein